MQQQRSTFSVENRSRTQNVAWCSNNAGSDEKYPHDTRRNNVRQRSTTQNGALSVAQRNQSNQSLTYAASDAANVANISRSTIWLETDLPTQ
jgi:hypothetical protein